MIFRLRLLPITTVSIAVLIGVKAYDMVQNGESIASSLFASPVSAQQEAAPPEVEAAPAEEAKPEEAPAGEGEAPKPAPSAAAPDNMEMGAADKASATTAAVPAPAIETAKGGPDVVINPAGGLNPDAPKGDDGGGRGLAPQSRYYSPVELEILQTLSKRREQLDSWEKEIEIKENLLASTEKRIEEKVVEIEDLKVELKKAIEQFQTQEDSKIRSLVKIYENMKPREAARIFDEVEMPILLLVIDRMAEKKAAPILASMDPKKAKQLTVELAEQRRLNKAKISNISRTSAPVQ